MTFRVDTATPPPSQRFVDLMDPPTYATSFANGLAIARRGFVWTAGGGPRSPGVLDNINNFAPGSSPGGLYQGALWANADGNAILFGSHAQAYTSVLQMPMGVDQAAGPVSARQPLRYQLEAVLVREIPLAANVPLSFSIQWESSGVLTLSDSTAAGYELVSTSGLNAGRWTVRQRIASGGALVELEDTGIDPLVTDQVHVALRYDHTTNPRASFLVNGAEFGVRTGLAQMCTPNATIQQLGISYSLSAGSTAGQMDRFRQCRYWIEELAGFQ